MNQNRESKKCGTMSNNLTHVVRVPEWEEQTSRQKFYELEDDGTS